MGRVIFTSFPRSSVTAIKLSSLLPPLTKGERGGFLGKSSILNPPSPPFFQRGNP